MSVVPLPERKRYVDGDSVGAAAVAVAESGRLISVTAVRNELGNGSNETVAKYLRPWAEKHMPVLAGRATAPNWSARELEGINVFREVMRAEAAHSFAEERAAWEEKLRAAAAEVGEAKAAVARAERAQEQAQERAAGLETGLTALKESLEAGARDREGLLQQINALQAAGAETARQYEQTVSDLRKQVTDAVDRYAGMEKHMLLQIDRARTERDEIRAKAADDARMAEARRVRDSGEIERLRVAREEASDKANRLEVELQQAATGRADAERRLAVAEEQAATVAPQIAELARQVTTMAAQNEALSARTLAAESSRARRDIAQLGEELSAQPRTRP